MVALDNAGKTLTDGGAGHVDLLAFREDVGAENSAGLVFGNFVSIDMELFQHGSGFNASLGEFTGSSLVDARGLFRAERDLDCIVAVGFHRLHTRDTVTGHIEHRHGDGLAVILEDARHADLAAD